jgi:hypothetical protein
MSDDGKAAMFAAVVAAWESRYQFLARLRILGGGCRGGWWRRLPHVPKPCRKSEPMWVPGRRAVRRFIARALHPKWAVAVVELIDKFFGSIGDKDRSDDFCPLDDDPVWAISLTSGRRCCHGTGPYVVKLAWRWSASNA